MPCKKVDQSKNRRGQRILIATIVEKDSNGGGSVSNTVNSFAYAYDNADRLTSKTENGTTTSYGYDYDGEVTTVNGSTLYSYDATGNSTASGVNVTTGNELQTDGNFDYTYDPEGNLTSKVALSGNTLGITTGDNWTYGYDNKNEMTSAVEKTSGGTPELSVTYRYDAFGNRVEKDVTPYSSGTAGTTVVSRFAYDMWKASGGHLFSGENSDIWAEMNGSSSLTYRFMNGDAIDQVFAQMAYTGSTYTPTWLFTDYQGSVRDVVDSTGHVIDAIAYGTFGNITSETNSADRDLYTYTGRILDGETNLQENRDRYYNSSTQRWQSEDPIGFRAGDSNIYRYVGNDPTNATDPSGLEEVWINGQLVNLPATKSPQFGQGNSSAMAQSPIPPPAAPPVPSSGNTSNNGTMVPAFGGLYIPERVEVNQTTRELQTLGGSITVPHNDVTVHPAGFVGDIPDSQMQLGQTDLSAIVQRQNTEFLTGLFVSSIPGLSSIVNALNGDLFGFLLSIVPDSLAMAGIIGRLGSTPNTSNLHPTFRPGPYAGESIPAQSTAQTFTAAERTQINQIGSQTGCHTCGTTNPATRSGNFVPDLSPCTSKPATKWRFKTSQAIDK